MKIQKDYNKNIMKNLYVKGKRNNAGITLIALVITIIILLILAGISISAIKENGLFEKAKYARNKAENAQKLENEILLSYEEEISQIDGSIKYNNWTTLLKLAGIENEDDYSEQEIMNKIMNNEKAVNYMINSTDSIMPAIVDSEIAMNEIKNSTIAKNKILENSIWINAIKNSENKEIVLTNLLPIMQSNTQDGIKLTVSDVHDVTIGDAFKSCDENDGTCWATKSGDYGPHWFKIEFDKKHVITSYYLKGGYTWGEKYVIPKFYLQASNDNENWVNLEGDTIHEGNTTGLMEYNVQLENTTGYKYYRFYYPQGAWVWGYSGMNIITILRLFGI